MVSAWLQLGYSSINLNRTGLRLMDFCYDGWTDRVLQKAPTSTLPMIQNKQTTINLDNTSCMGTHLTPMNSRSRLAFLGSSWAHN